MMVTAPRWLAGGRRPRIPGSLCTEIAEAVARSGAVDVVVIDSVAALVPRTEVKGQMDDSHMALPVGVGTHPALH